MCVVSDHCYGSSSSLVSMDCKEVEGLCLGEGYEISCTAHSDNIVFQQLQLEAEKCDKMEVDFRKDEQLNSTECGIDDVCGKICGTLKQSNPAMIIDMHFAAESSSDTKITCYGISLLPVVDVHHSYCNVTFAGMYLKS